MPVSRAKARPGPIADPKQDAPPGATLLLAGVRDMVDLGDGVYVIQIDAAESKSHAELGKLHQYVAQRRPAASTEGDIQQKISEFSRALRAKQCHALSAVNPPPSEDNNSFLDSLRAQSMAERSRHVEEGTLLEAAELWSRLGITRQAVSKQIKQQKMFAIDGPRGQKLYPAFFTEPDFDQSALRRVCQTLGDLPAAGKWQFFTTGKVSLGGRTPLAAVADGDLAEVLAAATAFRGR